MGVPCRQPLCARVHVCVCIYACACVCVCVHQVVATSRGEEGEATVSVTDEAEEWKEGNVFAWGAATVPWVGGTNRSMQVVTTDDSDSVKYPCTVAASIDIQFKRHASYTLFLSLSACV